jgi:hypothetical protein
MGTDSRPGPHPPPPMSHGVVIVHEPGSVNRIGLMGHGTRTGPADKIAVPQCVIEMGRLGLGNGDAQRVTDQDSFGQRDVITPTVSVV